MVKLESIKRLSQKSFCEYYLVHKGMNNIGDSHVFSYDEGNLIACDNYKCPYGNNDGSVNFHEGEGPCFGICNTFGLKKSIEDNLPSA